MRQDNAPQQTAEGDTFAARFTCLLARGSPQNRGGRLETCVFGVCCSPQSVPVSRKSPVCAVRDVRLTGLKNGGIVPNMSISTIASKHRTSIPNDIISRAGLNVSDELAWEVLRPGEIVARRIESTQPKPGKLVMDSQTGLYYWSAPATYEEMEAAALNANPIRL